MQRLQNAHAIAAGHHDIEHEAVVFAALGVGQRIVAARNSVDKIAFCFKNMCERPQQARIVFGDQ